MVSILRTHKEAERELLEGSGRVTGVEEWPNCVSPPAALTRATRRIVWVPLEREEWSIPINPPSYLDMLAELNARRAPKSEEEVEGVGAGAGHTKMCLMDPILQRLPKHTVWSNWEPIVSVLDRSSAGADSEVVHVYHCTQLRAYIEAELATTSTLNGLGQLVLAGKWPLDGLRTLVRKYVKAFKQCSACRSYDTSLVRTGRVFKIRCVRCHTEGVV